MTMTQEEIEDELAREIDSVSKRYPEVSFAKLSRIAKHFAEWQKKQFEKERLAACDAMSPEDYKLESDFAAKHIQEHHCLPTFIDAIRYGIEWEKQQTMKGAISAVVSQVPCLNEIILRNPASVDYWYLPSEMDKLGLNKGDKVKLILLKEETT